MLLQQSQGREKRYPYTGTIHLNIQFGVWGLKLELQGLNLSRTGLLAHISPQLLAHEISFEDLYALLSEGDRYNLQIESPFENIDSPVLNAVLTRKITFDGHLQLAFEFEQDTNELISLVHEHSINTQH